LEAKKKVCLNRLRDVGVTKDISDVRLIQGEIMSYNKIQKLPDEKLEAIKKMEDKINGQRV